ncbi:Yggt family protein [Candidatus Moduliflexus flocculans]|uniref:Yggt family protein n=1 Tax=Candidatus Moduliflexus flocculans TaxID=1499966 RepID=A0A0S6W156_9BACT|nr:Yggt family protein [Candidatus Moduliflexus flocculans]
MNPLIGLANLIDLALEVYIWIIFIAVILSWIPRSTMNPNTAKIARFFDRATEPVFTFFRKVCRLDRFSSPIDIAPLIVILAIYFFRMFVVQSMRNMNPLGNLLHALFYTVYFLLNIYFWIVAFAAVVVVAACFWPHHPIAQIRIPLLDRLTRPVFEFFRRVLHSPLEIHIQNAAMPLDAAPFLSLLAIYLLKRLLLALTMSV